MISSAERKGRESSLWILSVRRPVSPSSPSIFVILFLPKKSERRLDEMGRFSIVCDQA